MRDFRDAKAMAQALRAALAAKGVKISVGESLELIAKALGAGDWNTLSAQIRAARPRDPEAGKTQPTPPVTPAPESPGRAAGRFSQNLEVTLHRAVAEATRRQHEYTTLEHLLLAMADDEDVASVLRGCKVDLGPLRASLTRYLDEDMKVLIRADAPEQRPTAGFHRVVQRAVIHVQASATWPVTGANLLVAMFSETESRACQLLTGMGMTRFDAVNFIVYGEPKDDPAA